MRTLNIEALAEQAAGNWRCFQSFGWHNQPDDAELWTIVYTHNRDSGLLDQSNADAIAGALEPFLEDGTVVPEHHGHWGCGWVDGYAIRVYNAPGGSITPAFACWCEIQEALVDYPVLDDEDYSRREYEACLESIEERSKFAGPDAPEDWAGEVFSWLWENDQRQCENCDDQGAYPSDESIQAALKGLGWLEPEYDDNEE